jgi:hypothetical protein
MTPSWRLLRDPEEANAEGIHQADENPAFPAVSWARFPRPALLITTITRDRVDPGSLLSAPGRGTAAPASR